jgi:hypothetical protein
MNAGSGSGTIKVIDEWEVQGERFRLINKGVGPVELETINPHTEDEDWRKECGAFKHGVLCSRIAELSSRLKNVATGRDVIDRIIECDLVSAEGEGVCVWSPDSVSNIDDLVRPHIPLKKRRATCEDCQHFYASGKRCNERCISVLATMVACSEFSQST